MPVGSPIGASSEFRAEHATRLAENPRVRIRPRPKKTKFERLAERHNFASPARDSKSEAHGALAPYLLRGLEKDSRTTRAFSARGRIDAFSRACSGVFAARLTVCSYDPRKKSRERESSRHGAPFGASPVVGENARRSFSRGLIARKRRLQASVSKARGFFHRSRARVNRGVSTPSRPLAVPP